MYAAPVAIHAPDVRFNAKIISYAELRKHKLVRQGWDTSCGAAAMATLMTYHHNRPVSETAIALTLLKNTDPDRVRQRGGFSLLDLKRYAEAVGFSGKGFGGMTLHDLDKFSLPAILPVRIRNFDHFVVFRQRLGDRILIGDPAFGNLTINEDEFKTMWSSQIAFYVLDKQDAEKITRSDWVKKLSPMSAEQSELAIPDINYSRHMINRLPLLPLTRKIHRVTP